MDTLSKDLLLGAGGRSNITFAKQAPYHFFGYAQNPTTTGVSQADRTWAIGIDSSNKSAYGITYNSAVYYKENSSETWVKALTTTGTTIDMNTTGQRIWCFGQNVFTYSHYSTDGGNTWTAWSWPAYVWDISYNGSDTYCKLYDYYLYSGSPGSWTLRLNANSLKGSNYKFYCVRYVSFLNKWFAGGTNGMLYSSSDGVTWTDISITFTDGIAYSNYKLSRTLVSMADNGSTFVIAVTCGSSGGFTTAPIILSSTNGTSFTQRTSGLPANGQDINGVVWSSGASKFVGRAGGYYNFSSSDGTTWSATQDFIPDEYYTVYCGVNYLAREQKARCGDATKADASSNWYVNDEWFIPGSIAYNGSTYVFVGSRNCIQTSSDLITWTNVSFDSTSLPSANYYSDVVYASGMSKFVALKGSNSYYSTNGSSWSTGGSIADGGNICNHLYYDSTNNVVYAWSTPSVSILRSTDGINWTTVSSGSHVSYAGGMASTGSTIILGYYDGVLRSTNGGTSWSLVVLTYKNIQAVAYDTINSRFVAYSAFDSIYIQSTDGGATWSTISGSIYFTPSRFKLAFDSKKNVFYSASYGDYAYKLNLNSPVSRYLIDLYTFKKESDSQNYYRGHAVYIPDANRTFFIAAEAPSLYYIT